MNYASISFVLLLTALGFSRSAFSQDKPDSTWEEMAEGPLQVRLLPGTKSFIFTNYGAPGELAQLKELVATMQREKIGNGFDPGPGVGPSSRPLYEFLREVGWPVVGYAQTSDHQVKDGTCRLSDEQEVVLRILDDAGIFAATQLGEWGYYYHNLSHRESWWRAVYGDDFENRRSQMKPAGLAGFDATPASKRDCHAIVKDYFESRQRAMRGWNLSITGHSHYEAYVGQWGAKVIGLELGENIAFTQSKIAFARGASRRNGLPWSIQVSQWFAGSTTSSGPLVVDANNGTARGLDAGHSLNFYERMWLHAWFAGTAMVTPEASSGIFYEKETPPYVLTSHGRKASEMFQFMQSNDRGVPYMPIAIVLDELSGYNAYMGKPWGILEPTAGDTEVADLFQEQLFPGSDHIHRKPFPENPEASYLRPTPFGEIFDVQLSDAPKEVLAAYPVLLLAGDHSFEPGFVETLRAVVASGGRLLVGQRNAEAMGEQNLTLLRAAGSVEILEPWNNPATNRSSAIANSRLNELVDDLLPVRLTGDPILYQCNRTARGWVIELVNNAGVTKFPTKAAVIDPLAAARVTLRLRKPAGRISNLRTGIMEPGDQYELMLGPGESIFIAWEEHP
ncbi:MAG: hypothetical protein R3F19_15895 [Verrucomicrobiales bacterium]